MIRRLQCSIPLLLAGCLLHCAPAPVPTPDATVAEWREVSAEDLLLIDLEDGTVFVELAPAFAPEHVERMRELARAEHYDENASFYRVIEGFVAQGGVYRDVEEGEDEDLAYDDGVPPLPAEFERPLGDDLHFVPLGSDDLHAPEVGHVGSLAVGVDPQQSTVWPLHCPGTMAMARDPEPDTGSSHFYIVIGRDQRYLDRNLSVFGRVIEGMPLLQRLERGTRAVGNGVIPDPERRSPILSVRLASDLPAGERPTFRVMRPGSSAFAELKDSKFYRDSEFFIRKPRSIEACAVLPPAERIEEPGLTRAK